MVYPYREGVTEEMKKSNRKCVICGKPLNMNGYGRYRVICGDPDCKKERHKQTDSLLKKKRDQKGLHTRYERKFEVLVKCPSCEKERIEIFSHKPNVKPRIFCRKCEYKRNSLD